MIRRGEIYLADLDPVRGHEQAGTRPALIIQNDIGNQYYHCRCYYFSYIQKASAGAR